MDSDSLYTLLKEACKKAVAPNGKYISVDDGSPRNSIEELDSLNELVETEKLKPISDSAYSLAGIVEAHRYVEKGRKKGNVVITMPPGN